MGCRHSASVKPSGGDARAAGLELRIRTAVQRIIRDRIEAEGSELSSASFTAIILKFPALRQALGSIHKTFKQFDVDNSDTIDRGELSAALDALGAVLTPSEVVDMFQYANFSNNGALSFKEFVLCLCLASVLEMFPHLQAYERRFLPHHDDAQPSAPASRTASTASAASGVSLVGTPAVVPNTALNANSAECASAGDAQASPASAPVSAAKSTPMPPLALSAHAAVGTQEDVRAPSPSSVAAAGAAQAHSLSLRTVSKERADVVQQGRRLMRALRIILEAYALFDTDGSGTIDRAEVLNMVDLENQKRKMPAGHARKADRGESVLLSRERWMELDYDDSGEISFAEFLHAFMDWIGIDDEEFEEEHAEAEAAAPAAAMVGHASGAQSARRASGTLSSRVITPRLTDAQLEASLTLPSRRHSHTSSAVPTTTTASGSVPMFPPAPVVVMHEPTHGGRGHCDATGVHTEDDARLHTGAELH